jgi:hypothetical protein
MVNPRQCLRVFAWHLAEETTLYKIGHHWNHDRRELLRRITANPEIFGGKPTIRGMRISVEMILSLLAFSSLED